MHLHYLLAMPCLILASLAIGGPAPGDTASMDASTAYAKARAAASGGRPVEALDLLEKIPADHFSVSKALTEPDFMVLHAESRFRALIKRHGVQSNVRMVTDDEPGQRMTVAGQVIRRAGVPVADARVYVYQTDHRGYYHRDKAFWDGQFEGDQDHARLFAYLKTDAQGRFEIRTIRPAGYPETGMPQHIHVEIEAEGYDRWRSEFLFEDDPRLTTEERARARRAGFLVAAVDRASDGSAKVHYTVKLRAVE